MAVAPEKNDQSLSLLGLSPSTITALESGGIKTVQDLVRRSEKDLQKIHRIGEIRLREIKKALARFEETEEESPVPEEKSEVSAEIDLMVELLRELQQIDKEGESVKEKINLSFQKIIGG